MKLTASACNSPDTLWDGDLMSAWVPILGLLVTVFLSRFGIIQFHSGAAFFLIAGLLAGTAPLVGILRTTNQQLRVLAPPHPERVYSLVAMIFLGLFVLRAGVYQTFLPFLILIVAYSVPVFLLIQEPLRTKPVQGRAMEHNWSVMALRLKGSAFLVFMAVLLASINRHTLSSKFLGLLYAATISAAALAITLQTWHRNSAPMRLWLILTLVTSAVTLGAELASAAPVSFAALSVICTAASTLFAGIVITALNKLGPYTNAVDT